MSNKASKKGTERVKKELIKAKRIICKKPTYKKVKPIIKRGRPAKIGRKPAHKKALTGNKGTMSRGR